MCGIAGFIDHREAPDPALLRRMTATLEHRGPGLGRDVGQPIFGELLAGEGQVVLEVRATAGADFLLEEAEPFTPEDLEARQKAVEDAGGQWEGYDGKCRDLDPAEAGARAEGGETCAWRLKTPTEGTTFWYDVIVDKREFPNEVLVDRVIMKVDGFPTYQFACVVDDHTMGMTHVLRGDDHVSNTPFQLLIYEALGWKPPKFGHMPMILGPDKKRLSKRHGAMSVTAYRDMGYLPEAVLNYLVRLGWSHGDDEIISMQQMIDWFDKHVKNAGSTDSGESGG